MSRPARLLLVMAVLAATAPVPAAATTPATDNPLRSDDVTAPIVAPPATTNAAGTNSSLDSDPLGLVPKLPFMQRYSLDTDHFEVWLCGNTGITLNQAISRLEDTASPYFETMSRGRYTVTFSAGGTSTDPDCLSAFQHGSLTPVGDPEGIFIVDDHTGGGYASPGFVCYGDSNCDYLPDTYPGNGRYAVVGVSALLGFEHIAIHELGHTLHWPHSRSGLGASDYDNPIDLMSGNSAIGGWTAEKAYGTLTYNLYQSGWVDPSEVVVADAGYQELVLHPATAGGDQLLVVPTATPGQFYTLDARVRSTTDPIPAEWEGVEVYFIDHDCDVSAFKGLCPSIWREQYQEPPNPEGVEHVLQVGESVNLEGIDVTVAGRNTDGFIVAVGNPAAAGLPFIDILGSQFVDNIAWLAGEGITAGCNPPLNTRFCPADPVTREQMAAFLVRALGLNDGGAGNRFTDDDGSIFETDIAKLAAAGITRGCNPPTNNHYCPKNPVTREQMAAFLVRALGLNDGGAGNAFTDDDGSIFETDIAKLAAAGITKGCNPPTNDHFCPKDQVTREQMAAFLHRADSAG